MFPGVAINTLANPVTVYNEVQVTTMTIKTITITHPTPSLYHLTLPHTSSR